MEVLYAELLKRQGYLRGLLVKIGAGTIKSEELTITPDMVAKELDLINAYLYQLDVQKAYSERAVTENA